MLYSNNGKNTGNPYSEFVFFSIRIVLLTLNHLKHHKPSCSSLAEAEFLIILDSIVSNEVQIIDVICGINVIGSTFVY